MLSNASEPQGFKNRACTSLWSSQTASASSKGVFMQDPDHALPWRLLEWFRIFTSSSVGAPGKVLEAAAGIERASGKTSKAS